MGIFNIFKNKKKNKEEVININSFNKEEDIEEDLNQEISPIIEEKPISLEEVKEKINQIDKNTPSIYNEYYKCKIFSRVALSEEEFNAQSNELDMYINNLDINIKEIKESFNEYNNDPINDELNRINANVNKTLVAQKVIKQRIIDINNDYYKQLKLSTASMCIKMNNDELKRFYKNVDDYVSEYKDIKEAAEHIYYNSGEFIVSTVNCLVSCIRETRNKEYINKYTYDYYLNSDVIISLEISEWIDLYNKIKFSLRFIKDLEIDKLLKMKEMFNRFEILYVILMMRSEMTSYKGEGI